VVAAALKPVEQQVAFVGRVAAVDKVELRARVEGFLKERRYTEGQDVAVGEVLFVIEPDQYEAIVAQRQADLSKALAEEENAQAQYARGEELLRQKNMSAAEVDKLRAAHRVAEASVEQARAALAAAQLDLDYTQIKAPVAGRVGRASLTVGNLVGPSSGVLATLVSQDPAYVLFPISQREFLEEKRRVVAEGSDPHTIIARAKLPDGTLYEPIGRLDYVDVTTDPGTDTLLVRAVFPNPEGLLVDGQFLGVVLAEDQPKDALVIPQGALQIDQQGTSVLVLDSENRVQIRRVETGTIQGANVIVLGGLKTGELVVTQGLQKVRPGQVVTATPADLPPAPNLGDTPAGTSTSNPAETGPGTATGTDTGTVTGKDAGAAAGAGDAR
jgi:membrane fusion protein (multidrug efflux system)